MKQSITLLCTLCLVIFAACGGQAPAPTDSPQPKAEGAAKTDAAKADAPKAEAAKKDSYTIAFSQCNSAEPYRAAQNKIMEKEIAKYPDCKLVIQDAQQDNAKQIAQIENFIQQKVDVIIVAPNEAAPLTAAVKKAKDSGIKVVCLERDLVEPVYDIFVGANNAKIGEMAGNYIGTYINDKKIENAVVVEMRGLLGTKPQEERHAGAIAVLEKMPNVKVISDVGNWIQSEAQKRMDTILQANPKIDVVYAHNDPMAVGCYLAAKNAGRENEMIFVGVDALGGPDGGIKHVLDGRLACTFYYPTCAADGLKYAVALAHGEAVPEGLILNPEQITAENAQQAYEKYTVE